MTDDDLWWTMFVHTKFLRLTWSEIDLVLEFTKRKWLDILSPLWPGRRVGLQSLWLTVSTVRFTSLTGVTMYLQWCTKSEVFREDGRYNKQKSLTLSAITFHFPIPLVLLPDVSTGAERGTLDTYTVGCTTLLDTSTLIYFVDLHPLIGPNRPTPVTVVFPSTFSRRPPVVSVLHPTIFVLQPPYAPSLVIGC